MATALVATASAAAFATGLATAAGGLAGGVDSLARTGAGLTGAAWVDDSQVEHLFAFKRLDADRPRVEVVIEAAI